jgi:hypothetical protein
MSQEYLVGDRVSVDTNGSDTGTIIGFNKDGASIRGAGARGDRAKDGNGLYPLSQLKLVEAIDPQTEDEANAYLEEHVDAYTACTEIGGRRYVGQRAVATAKMGPPKVFPPHGLDVVYADPPATTPWRQVLIAGAKNRPPSKVT